MVDVEVKLLGQSDEELPRDNKRQKKLNVVICVFHENAEHAYKSPLNQMLEELQIDLKKELEEYDKIEVAFVFNDDLLEIKEFQELESKTRIYYKEPSQAGDFAHIWFMGLALLEKKLQEEEDIVTSIENRVYLVTDEQLPREKVRLIIEEKDGELRAHSRFDKIDFIPYLYRSEETSGDILEEYILKGNENGIHILKRKESE